jgi:hypothetical protein
MSHSSGYWSKQIKSPCFYRLLRARLYLWHAKGWLPHHGKHYTPRLNTSRIHFRKMSFDWAATSLWRQVFLDQPRVYPMSVTAFKSCPALYIETLLKSLKERSKHPVLDYKNDSSVTCTWHIPVDCHSFCRTWQCALLFAAPCLQNIHAFWKTIWKQLIVKYKTIYTCDIIQ